MKMNIIIMYFMLFGQYVNTVKISYNPIWIVKVRTRSFLYVLQTAR